MASRCCLHILKSQWRQAAGETGASVATATLCPPTRLSSRSHSQVKITGVTIIT